MPDYEIRFFDGAGQLTVVHMSHHPSDEEAVSHASRLIGSHARYEIRCGNREIAAPRR